MTSSVRGRVRHPTSPRTNRILSLIFIVGGLGITAWGAWSLAGAVGPRTSSDGQVTGLDHTLGGSRTPEIWTVDVAWDGGTGSIESRGLYDALYPLEGDPAVTAERSAVTGNVLRVELSGQWYVAPGASVPLDVGRIALGLLVVAFCAFYFVRVAPATPGRELSSRMQLIGPLVVAGVFVVAGLGFLWIGAHGLLVRVGPRTTTNATVVAAAYNYVDLTLDGSTSRVTNSDLEMALQIHLGINKTFGNTDPTIVAIERSSADGSIERVTYDGQSYDVGPEILNSLVPFIIGSLELGFIVFLVVSIRREPRPASVRVPAAAVASGSAPASAPNPTLAPAPASAAPDLAAYGRIAGRIELELRRLGWWSATPPAEPVAGPFGEANATFTQWLEFVLCPQLREVAAGTTPAPRNSNVSAKAVREFDGQPEADSLIQVLSELDHLSEG